MEGKFSKFPLGDDLSADHQLERADPWRFGIASRHLNPDPAPGRRSVLHDDWPTVLVDELQRRAAVGLQNHLLRELDVGKKRESSGAGLRAQDFELGAVDLRGPECKNGESQQHDRHGGKQHIRPRHE